MGKVSDVVLVQPPFAQLNSPYPAPYYLKTFLEKKGFRVFVRDHSIALFERIFSRAGLERIFSDAANGNASLLPAEQRGRNGNTAGITERFFSERELWLNSIDKLIAFLRGRENEWGHSLALVNGSFPGGPRVDAFIAGKHGELLPEDAKILATKLLDDLADFITCTLDSGFSLIRYAPHIKGPPAAGYRDFSAVQKSLNGYIMDAFYRPMLAEEWEKPVVSGETGLFLLGLTIPFTGCLVPALVCAESAKKHFGSAVRTAAGGGYVNTELRFLNDPDFFDYFDYLSFDRGFGSLASILVYMAEGEKGGPIYKTMQCSRRTIIRPGDETPENSGLDDEAARTVFPDYSGVDFGRYLYPVDDANPMHRLWSDGHWLKAYLAHGCYWHSCAFCDVTLDYIKKFMPVDVPAFFAHLLDQAEKTGIHGIHLVDEAAPLSSLLELALLNREAGLPFSFWGNIRFEKDFTPDAAAILAVGGLIGVSAGLEVATERGFRRLGKGINLECAVGACAAFKEAGILTHAYLIYGYWDEDEQEIIDSAETLRQLFEHGLLDSAFWHKFVLTRHSRIYAEKQRGLHPDLIVKDDEDPGGRGSAAIFALNDLSFEGEGSFDKYSEGLERLLGAWMAGYTEVPAAEAFTFKVKAPAVPDDLVAGLLDKYAGDRDRSRAAVPPAKNRVLFLGSVPQFCRTGKIVTLRWYWQISGRELKTGGQTEAEKTAALLEKASMGRGLAAEEFYSSLEGIAGKETAKKIWKYLRRNGLALW